MTLRFLFLAVGEEAFRWSTLGIDVCLGAGKRQWTTRLDLLWASQQVPLVCPLEGMPDTQVLSGSRKASGNIHRSNSCRFCVLFY